MLTQIVNQNLGFKAQKSSGPSQGQEIKMKKDSSEKRRMEMKSSSSNQSPEDFLRELQKTSKFLDQTEQMSNETMGKIEGLQRDCKVFGLQCERIRLRNIQNAEKATRQLVRVVHSQKPGVKRFFTAPSEGGKNTVSQNLSQFKSALSKVMRTRQLRQARSGGGYS